MSIYTGISVVTSALVTVQNLFHASLAVILPTQHITQPHLYVAIYTQLTVTKNTLLSSL